jgi:hypothetical protein
VFLWRTPLLLRELHAIVPLHEAIQAAEAGCTSLPKEEPVVEKSSMLMRYLGLQLPDGPFCTFSSTYGRRDPGRCPWILRILKDIEIRNLTKFVLQL